MKLIKKGLILLLITFAVFFLLDEVFTAVFKNGTYNKSQWLNHIHDQQYDYIIHGSSRAYTTLNVGKLNKETGLKGLNISVDGSWIADQKLMLEMFLDKGNKMKKLYLQIDPWAVNKDSMSHFAIPKFFPYLKEDLVFNHYKDYGAQWYAYRYVPFYRYAEFNSTWGIHQVLVDMFNLMKPDFDEYGGHFYTETTYRGSIKMGDPSVQNYFFSPIKLDKYGKPELDENGKSKPAELKYLNKIIDICKKNNIELICFTAPVSNVNADEAYRKNIDELRKILESKEVKYYDFAPVYATQFDHFTDEIHLNPKGVAAFHEEFKKILIPEKTETK
jgi:hypothetical protein